MALRAITDGMQSRPHFCPNRIQLVAEVVSAMPEGRRGLKLPDIRPRSGRHQVPNMIVTNMAARTILGPPPKLSRSRPRSVVIRGRTE